MGNRQGKQQHLRKSFSKTRSPRPTKARLRTKALRSGEDLLLLRDVGGHFENHSSYRISYRISGKLPPANPRPELTAGSSPALADHSQRRQCAGCRNVALESYVRSWCLPLAANGVTTPCSAGSSPVIQMREILLFSRYSRASSSSAASLPSGTWVP